MKSFPALILAPASELLLAVLDDFHPTGIEEHDDRWSVFFAAAEQRDAACAALIRRGIAADPLDVPDEDWAARSQQGLQPITVGRLVILPDPALRGSLPVPTASPAARPAGPASDPDPIPIVVRPSMGFGKGHHATTRLCLTAMQACDLRGASVIDVGTGSGILAVAAAALGAARVSAFDNDMDAILAAKATLTLNPAIRSVDVLHADLSSARLPPADLVLANLTGAALARFAERLIELAVPDGRLILSGILQNEADLVAAAFRPRMAILRRDTEDEWVSLVLARRRPI